MDAEDMQEPLPERDMLKPLPERDMLKPLPERDMQEPLPERDMQEPLPERDMLKPPLEADMSITIGNFLKTYFLNDTKLASYDNDTKQIIVEILNGEIDKHVDSENDAILLYIAHYCESIKEDSRSSEKYYIMAAEHNNSYAMYILGNIYFNRKKLDLAEQYYIMAAEHNNTAAMRSLGIIYRRQNPLRGSLREASKLA